ncbi:chitin binding Peritrophin-A domain protein [Ostertagia ostertagi]
MKTLVLLTLVGLAVGLGVDRDCDGRVNGVYATSPCSNEFNHCYNGQVTIKTCPRGLVFNPDSNQCDFDSNVSGCAARAEVTCVNREDGAYTIGCSSTFFFCSNGIVHMSTCQNGLFYDVDRRTCDHKFRVRACGGHPEVQREPVTRPPLLVPTYAPVAMKSYAKIGGYAHVTDLSQSCKEKANGAHSLGGCNQQYVYCVDGVAQLAECAPGEVFGGSGKCTPVTSVPECSSSIASVTDCSSRPDGYYGRCSSDFLFCNGGIAQPMKCPSSLVFNEVKGYCDYPEDCALDNASKSQSRQDAQSSIHGMQRQSYSEPSKSVSPSFCAMRKDGFYAEKCSVEFVSCERGVATLMRCPPGLLFNEKQGYCDYSENCSAKVDAAVAVPVPDGPPQSSFASDDAMPILSSIDCKGKKDGYYSNGCSPEFVHCLDGVAAPMTCPTSLVFNERKGYCDYVESCSAGQAPTAPLPPPAPVVPVPAPASSGRSSFTATYTSTRSLSIDCKGRKDGYYSDGCVPEFVYCIDGVASPMTCPTSLVFNERKGYCDYVETCSVGPLEVVPVPAPPSPAVSSPAPAVAARSSISAAFTSSRSSSIDCKGRKDGFYSEGCVPNFVYCVDGVASPMTCPTSLVFNERKGHCDYVENCSVGPVPVDPAPAPYVPVVPVPTQSIPAPAPAASSRSSVSTTYTSTRFSSIDCKGRKDGFYSDGCVADFVYCVDGVASKMGRKDGYYSDGCVPDFVYCVDGIASAMTCPTSLVFNERKGYCDYPENCSIGPASAPPAPAVPLPAPAVSARSSFTATYTSTCPSSLVFNERKGFCDYAENCSIGPASAPPAVPPAVPAPSSTSVTHTSVRSSSIDCKGRKDGYYSDGCVPDFVYCIDGVASPMTCPTSLVFNERKGYCDYVESCSVGTAHAVPAAAPPAPAIPVPAPAVPARSSISATYTSVRSSSIDCKGRKDGYYSDGCTPDFVFCSDEVASPMTCPASLVYNQRKGYCDYPENCSVGAAPAVPAPVPLAPAAPVPAPAVPAKSSIAATYTSTRSSSIDCKGRKDGYYSDGTCPTSLVFNEQKGYCDYVENCSVGALPVAPTPAPPAPAVPVPAPATCPTSLVFNERKGYCDYPENCSIGPARAPPAPAVPVPAPAAPVPAPAAPVSVPALIAREGRTVTTPMVVRPTSSSAVMEVASPMTCPASLVYNQRKGYCDYPENCSVGAAPAVPAPVPLAPAAPVPAPAVPAKSSVDCKGRKDGYYSDGCVPDFVYCADGVASPMTCPTFACVQREERILRLRRKLLHWPSSGSTSSCASCGFSSGSEVFYHHNLHICSIVTCPASLVFDERKGYCDYPENCSIGPAQAPPAPAVPVPAPAAPVPALAEAARSIDCKGRKDGYYSDGCVPDFVYCIDGVASPMTCPTSLVFNERKGYCDYVENCSVGTAPAVPKCPASLVFIVEKGYCDYPENCSGREMTPAMSQKADVVSICPEPNGAYSNGCTSEFYMCSNGAAHVQLCPGDLVFNANEGYCDLKEACIKECSSFPDGRYGSPCGTKFMICSSGVGYFMECPADLVFDSKQSRCVYSHECGLEPVLKSSSDAAPSSYTSLMTRDDCIGKHDGLHSLGCIAEFIQCVDGKAYSLYCPAGLVFVESLGICDVPSACSGSPKHEAIGGPMFYEPVTNERAKDDQGGGFAFGLNVTSFLKIQWQCDFAECDTNGYFSKPCSSEYFNCVGGRKFMGKCPAGLVFNADKVYCDYPENCRQGESVASSEARPVPSTVIHKDESCKGRPDGVITETDCQHKFTTCLNGVSFVTKCPGGLVYSVAGKLCDYPEACGTASAASVSSHSTTSQATSYSTERKAVISHEGASSSASAVVRYQHSTIGKDLCAGRSDGPLNSTDCRPSFSFCVNGALYSTICPEGLLYSFVSRRCEWASECGNVVAHSEPSKVTTAAPVHSVADSKRTYTKASPAPPASNSVKVYQSAPRMHSTSSPVRQASDSVKVYQSASSARQASESTRVSIVDGFDCSTRANGKYSLGGCVERFVMCSEGRAYVRGCPAGLVYNEAKGLCDYDCSGSAVGSSESEDVSRYDVKKSESSHVQSSVTYTHSSSSASAAPVEAECVTSIAMGRCSSKFWRCRNGKLESAQCPGQSLFDETFLLCVYDLPECKTKLGITTATPEQVKTTTMMPAVSTDAVYTSSEIYSAPSSSYQASASHAQQYSMHYPPYGGAMNNPFGIFYPPVLPFGFQDIMHGRDKVNHGPINFESRSALAGGYRVPVRDIFDGIVSPWLLPGIDRVFVPRRHDRRRDRDHLFDELRGPQGIDISSLLETPTEGIPAVAGSNDGMLLEDAVPHEDGEHHQEMKSGHEAELEKVPVEGVPSFIETTTFPDGDDVEGSGDAEMAACPVGDLFDSGSNKCVASETCGLPEQVPVPVPLEPIPVLAPTPATASQRYFPRPTAPVTVPPVPVLSPAHAMPTSTTTKRPPVIYPPVPVPVSHAGHVKPMQPSVPAPVPAASTAYQPQQTGCVDGSDYAVDCNGNFIKCVHGIAYPMKCPAGLVFDQTKHYCDYPAAVVGCGGVQMDNTRPDHSFSVPTDKTYPGEPILPSPTQAPSQQTPDFCAYLSDGPHSEGCTASFVVCHDRRTQLSMNCPVGTWFDQTRGICDFREKVAACGGALDEPLSYQPKPIVVRTTTPASHDSSCSQDPQPMGRCASKFLVCSNGIKSEFDCAKPLVFNPATLSCDFREFVPDCEQFKEQYADSAENDATVPTVASYDATTATSTAAAPLTCVYSDERPAFALDYCSRVYGMCTVHGVLERKECSVGFLFDSHLSTCVPSEQCGQEHLKELISKATYAPPEAAAQVAKDTVKHTTRKDDRCHNSLEGAMKPMGRCRSSYIRCMGGEAVVESCATTAEVFSSAVGACVLRINAPECRSAPQRSPQPYMSAPSSDPAMFCKTRTDGLYRNPSDCTAILQCFGGDVFEYPSCTSGLVFNELTAKCDYREAVPECRQAADEGNVERGCRGASHGDFVANESDCQQFYRCVWDRLESMRCPSGTVFNPKLSVCDWPDNVPQCSAQQQDSVTKAY